MFAMVAGGLVCGAYGAMRRIGAAASARGHLGIVSGGVLSAAASWAE